MDAIAPWRDATTPAAELAAYVLWSATVRPAGFLSRAAVLMSKHWMNKISSWDHCFNALALAEGAPRLSWDQYQIPFDHQDAAGALPDSVTHSEVLHNFVKPPIHGWALSHLRHLIAGLTTADLENAYKQLTRWTMFWLNQRRAPDSDLPYYQHGNDSGWDNATLDEQRVIEAPDLAAFLVLQLRGLAWLAARLGHDSDARSWTAGADELRTAMLDQLWRDDQFAVREPGSPRRWSTSSLLLLMPIILGQELPDAIRATLAQRIEAHLTTYGLATGLPTSPQYASDGYWRGPIRAPSTVLIEDGLRPAGHIRLADEISRRFRALCEKSGFAENFDAQTGAGLRDRAYTWTAGSYLRLAGADRRRQPHHPEQSVRCQYPGRFLTLIHTRRRRVHQGRTRRRCMQAPRCRGPQPPSVAQTMARDHRGVEKGNWEGRPRRNCETDKAWDNRSADAGDRLDFECHQRCWKAPARLRPAVHAGAAMALSTDLEGDCGRVVVRRPQGDPAKRRWAVDLNREPAARPGRRSGGSPRSWPTAASPTSTSPKPWTSPAPHGDDAERGLPTGLGGRRSGSRRCRGYSAGSDQWQPVALSRSGSPDAGSRKSHVSCEHTDWSPIAAAAAKSSFAGFLAGFVFACIVTIMTGRRAAGREDAVTVRVFIAAFVCLVVDSYIALQLSGNVLCQRAWAETATYNSLLAVGVVAIFSGLSWLVPGSATLSDAPNALADVQSFIARVTYVLVGVAVVLLEVGARGYLLAVVGSHEPRTWYGVAVQLYAPVVLVALALVIPAVRRHRYRRRAAGARDEHHRWLRAAATVTIVVAVVVLVLIAVMGDLSAGVWNPSPPWLVAVGSLGPLVLAAVPMATMLMALPLDHARPPGNSQAAEQQR